MSLPKALESRWFALADLVLVTTSGLIWIFFPDIGVWPLGIAILPWGLRLVWKKFPFRSTPFDLLIGLFFITAIVGFWASYNKTAAWEKIWLVILSILLYYALAAQPDENFIWISSSLYLIAVGIAVYFFLTHNFNLFPRKLQLINSIGLWWMGIRPKFSLPAIQANYVSGIAIVTAVYGLPLAYRIKKAGIRVTKLLFLSLFIGFSLILSALITATSRGAWMAMGSACGAYLIWKFLNLKHLWGERNGIRLFPIMIMALLTCVTIFLYLGPAKTGSDLIQGNYSNGSRAELFQRSLSLVRDFPFTGGGLQSFPGLYSQYVLVIPFYYVPNSHNMFLDVAIEQGLFGGFAFLLLYLIGIWYLSKTISKGLLQEKKIYCWIALLSLIMAVIHGMVDDYLYNGKGTLLALFLIGFSLAIIRDNSPQTSQSFQKETLRKPSFTLLNYVIKKNLGILIVSVLVLGITFIFWERIIGIWYANIGAIQMARIELKDFPKNEWDNGVNLEKMVLAESLLEKSIQFDPENLTANHRLGLISMLRRDFDSAAHYLVIAQRKGPQHRGLIKTLGYCYVWMDELDQAKALLITIPEAKDELGVYAWWWKNQDRSDLADRASNMVSILGSTNK